MSQKARLSLEDLEERWNPVGPYPTTTATPGGVPGMGPAVIYTFNGPMVVNPPTLGGGYQYSAPSAPAAPPLPVAPAPQPVTPTTTPNS